MEEKLLEIEPFLADISPDFAQVISALHLHLTGAGCLVGMQQAKSGHVVSYTHPETKKVVANFVTRKKGPVIRIYGDHAADYEEFLETLPEELKKLILKAGACRRMLDPTKCNARCPMGYSFLLGGERQQKCRYNCFMLPVREDTLPVLQELLSRELVMRAAKN